MPREIRSSGSVYVAAVFVLLAGYFVYQWWFNPHRVIKRRLGDLAAVLSVGPAEGDVTRLARMAQLRRYFAERVRTSVADSREEMTRDALIAAIDRITPATGANVDFVDVQVNVDSDTTARADLSVEMTTRDAQSGEQRFDARDGSASFVREDGEWLISGIEVKAAPLPRSAP